MKKLKRLLLNWRFKFKYRNRHVLLGKNTGIYGHDTFFEGFNRIGEESVFSGTIGYGSYIGGNCHINATIGRYCCIADRVYTVSGTHPVTGFVSIHPAFYSACKQSGFSYVTENCFNEKMVNPVDGKTAVYIGNDVWIGCNVTLIGGIKIGDGAIIAAGAVVTRDVDPYSIVGGIPAKFIKNRFEQDQIDFLKNFKWWEKSTEWIAENHKDFQNVDEFIGRYDV